MNTEYMIQQLKQRMEERGGEKHQQKMYDPFRRYRKGDIVQARLYGRGYLWARDGQQFTVAADEEPGNPNIRMEEKCVAMGHAEVYLPATSLRLLEPAEERRPYNLLAWEAIRMMQEEQKIMERPFVGLEGKPDLSRACVQITYVPGDGFKWRFWSPETQDWGNYVLNKPDMEVMWREADGKEGF